MPQKSLFLQTVRYKARVRRFSPRTERVYVAWIRRFIRFHGLRHPKELGEAQVAAFLNHLAAERGVAPSTQTQALCALLFLYEHVLGPFVRRGRVLTPSAAAWDALGLTLATLRPKTDVDPGLSKRSFAFDILLAYSAREAGAVVITSNRRDMERIRTVFAFEFTPPFPDRP